MSGRDRYPDIVNLFDETKSNWTISEIAFSLDVPTSAVCRTVRGLLAAEMLAERLKLPEKAHPPREPAAATG